MEMLRWKCEKVLHITLKTLWCCLPTPVLMNWVKDHFFISILSIQKKQSVVPASLVFNLMVFSGSKRREN